MCDLGTYLDDLRARLSRVSDSAALDTQVLLAHVFGRSRAWVLAHLDATLTPEQESALADAIMRLEAGEPLPYVLGRWEFYGLAFRVTADTLIPRPETELVVERALAWLQENPARRWAVDVGAGSGCVGVALAVNIPDLRILAVDLTLPALQVAQANARAHAVDNRVRFLQADLFPVVSKRFDLICANLPYIPSDQLAALPVARREPRLALDGGADGLDLVRRLLRYAPRLLSPGGLALLEIGATQGPAARQLAEDIFREAARVRIWTDLAGRDRLLSIESQEVL